MIPSALGYLDLIKWIPVDIFANIIVELAATAELHQGPKNGFHKIDVEPSGTIPVYHGENPEFARWIDLLPTVQNSLVGSNMRVVTWGEWVDALSKTQHAAADVEQNPGLKLLDFFEALRRDDDAGLTLPIMDTERAEMKSGVLAGLKPVGAVWMEIWLKQWAF